MSAPWLVGMNPEQAAVIAHDGGPLYCGAVAGCGKTRAAVNRIARLVDSGVEPSRILAVTFSSKASGEMNVRLKELGVRHARVGTWHSLALQILKEDFLPQSGWAIDEKDRHKSLVKEACGYKYLDWKAADASKVRSFIGFCKANMWLPESDEAMAEAEKRFEHDARRARDAYRISDELTHGLGLLTFDDMLLFAARHLQGEDAAARWSAKWDYVIVDEAQDNSVVQEVMAGAIASSHSNIMAVGDVAQAIYGFRGSTPQHLASFPTRWPTAKTIVMNRNYRSGRAIVRAANLAIAPAEVRLPVEMLAERDLDGVVRSVCVSTVDCEAAEFVSWVQSAREDDRAYSEMTCLFRTNAQSRALEDKLLQAKIPYVVVGGGCFYERKEVKDLLAYLRVAAGRDDEGDAVRRCINAPFRFLGKAFVDRLMHLSQQSEGESWVALVEQAAQQSGVQRRQVQSAREWCSIVAQVKESLTREVPENPGNLLLSIIHHTRYVDWLVKEEGEDSIENSAASNVRELARIAGAFKTVTELLDYVDENIRERARMQKKQKGDRVLLMSVHRSKGLEWPLVWVCGCNEGILPHAKGDLEEERRLFYVAVTRARDELVLSYVERVEGPRGPRPLEPSRFLADARV